MRTFLFGKLRLSARSRPFQCRLLSGLSGRFRSRIYKPIIPTCLSSYRHRLCTISNQSTVRVTSTIFVYRTMLRIIASGTTSNLGGGLPSQAMRRSAGSVRLMATQMMGNTTGRKEGDISSVFVSLSGGEAAALPTRFADQKRRLIAGNEDKIIQSWNRLLSVLKDEVEIIHKLGPSVVPQIDFADINSPPSSFVDNLKKRGVAVIRGVVPETEALSYKSRLKDYIRANPQTKGL
ncbi:uncharacterized protein V1510DRAFT_328215 [Dipodascopsis tothii]|uniref:uncharacterized protein n=1 Tax=Dipodascopsis tothii TaxID=44089 RepID=UPI0034CF6C1B